MELLVSNQVSTNISVNDIHPDKAAWPLVLSIQ
jgi:hypothetical protein